jgi:hypothetical protein
MAVQIWIQEMDKGTMLSAPGKEGCSARYSAVYGES